MAKTASPNLSDALPYLQCLNLTVKLALKPHATSDPLEAIRSKINKMLFKYDESLGGVPLAYQDISFAPGKEFGRIYADQPWIYVEAELSKLLIFCPVAGAELTGRISKVHLSSPYKPLVLTLY